MSTTPRNKNIPWCINDHVKVHGTVLYIPSQCSLCIAAVKRQLTAAAEEAAKTRSACITTLCATPYPPNHGPGSATDLAKKTIENLKKTKEEARRRHRSSSNCGH